ncbi:MAG: ATP-binding protein, partial [Methanosarcina sp.]|nr:ATP-binding protein [Methanosarcina sp.]
MKIVERLADHYISVGDLDSAIVWLETGLETDRLNVEMNYLKLTCLRDLGQFQQMVENINLLENLYQQNDEQLPDEFVDLREKAEISRRIEDQKTSHTWPIEEKDEVTFFGRKAELEKLNWAMHRKGVILLQGEAGSGKTRLIKEFYCQQAYSPRLFYCQSHPLSTRVPFLTLLTEMEKEIREEEWNLLSQSEKDILLSFYRRYLQSSALADLPKGADDWLPVFQDIFNLFVKLMEFAARKRPVLLVLDDAQW